MTYLYENDNSILEISFFTSKYKSKFYINAITTGKSEMIVPISIHVCGYELIEVSDDKIYYIMTYSLLTQPKIIELNQLFRNT